MSGIEEIKEKMIKKKLLLEDLPVPSPKKNFEEYAVHSPGKTNIQTNVQPFVQTTEHSNERTNLSIPEHMEEQKNIHTDVKPHERVYANTSIQQNTKTVTQTTNDQPGLPSSQIEDVTTTGVIGNDGLDVRMYSNTATQQRGEAAIQPTAQNQDEAMNNGNQTMEYRGKRVRSQSQGAVYVRKLTVYLSEELHKTFNNIYAQRMLEGRHTEKSALMCEAVALLHQREQEQRRKRVS